MTTGGGLQEMTPHSWGQAAWGVYSSELRATDGEREGELVSTAQHSPQGRWQQHGQHAAEVARFAAGFSVQQQVVHPALG